MVLISETTEHKMVDYYKIVKTKNKPSYQLPDVKQYINSRKCTRKDTNIKYHASKHVSSEKKTIVIT